MIANPVGIAPNEDDDEFRSILSLRMDVYEQDLNVVFAEYINLCLCRKVNRVVPVLNWQRYLEVFEFSSKLNDVMLD